MTEDVKKRKAELAGRILILDSIKHNSEYSRQIREKADDSSAKCYDELLKLCDGDAQVVASLLGQKEWYGTKVKHI